MGKNNTVLLLAVSAVGVYLLTKNQEGNPLEGIAGLFSGLQNSGGLPDINLDLGGISEGFGDGGIGGGLADLLNNLAKNINGFQENLQGIGGDSGSPDGTNQSSFWDTTTTNPTGNPIVDTSNAIGSLAMNLGKGAIIGGMAYGGVKAAPIIAAAAKGLAPAFGSLGSGISTTIRTAGLGASKGAGALASGIRSSAPSLLSRASVITPKIPAVLAVAGAGLAGYGVGTLFNKSPVGKAVLNTSEKAGKSFFSSSLGKAVNKNLNPIGELTNHSKIIQKKTDWVTAAKNPNLSARQRERYLEYARKNK